MRTIRSRIALWALAVLLLLVFLESGLVLGGLQNALLEVADRELRGELEALSRRVADLRLPELQRLGEAPGTGLGDLVFELQDELESQEQHRSDALLYIIRRDEQQMASSGELLQQEFGPGGKEKLRDGITFREVPDPRRPEQSEPLRVASLDLGPYRVELARSLGPTAAIYKTTRTQLLVILAVVSALGAIGSYWIAQRALAPVRQLIGEARRLRTLSAGSLPRTGRADEIDDLAEVLNELLGRIRSDVLRIQRFTADAAHEIRTPLAAIRGHLELLIDRVDAEAEGTIVMVLEEVARLSRLVDQLLFLEKLQQEPVAEKRERVDFGEIASDLVGHVRILAEEQDVVLEGEFQDAPVFGDPEKLRQILLNLIDNALKFTPPGGRIGVEVHSVGDWARAVITDTGPGVPEDELEQIFERFASDRTLSAAGTGLGLPIARAIARSHGGDLRVERGDGAVFTCELPLAR